ncbi:hypothetical protein FRC02_011228 [Tulasnella sp. 418]|nr:hypothetical protein FRC02_011228 [Tulasnella sp. 418]
METPDILVDPPVETENVNDIPPSEPASTPQPSKKRRLSHEPSSEPSSTPAPTPNAGPTLAKTPTFLPSPDGLPYYTTADVPMNRQGFRYTPAGPSGPDCILSHRTVESPPTNSVRVSWEDRSPYVRVTPDGLGLMGDKGFRSARLNVPVKEGKWYLEVKIEKGGGEGTGQGANVRLGWGRREAPLNGPTGMDGYSYAYRDKTGDKVTLARPRPYGRSFGSGDVIGLYISLPPRRVPNKNDPYDPARVMRKRIAINYKNQLYFESMDYSQSKEMIGLMDLKKPSPSAPTSKSTTTKNAESGGGNSSRRRKSKPTPMPDLPSLRPVPILEGSCIAFFVNGECQGPAFTDILDYLQLRFTPKDNKARKGMPAHLRERENLLDDGSLGYYPFISVFNDARISINAGPDFHFPPPPDIDTVLNSNQPKRSTSDLTEEEASKPKTWRPLCERYPEYMQEEWDQDEKDEQEARRAHKSLQLGTPAEQLNDPLRAKKKTKIVMGGDKKKKHLKKSGLSEVLAVGDDQFANTSQTPSEGGAGQGESAPPPETTTGDTPPEPNEDVVMADESMLDPTSLPGPSTVPEDEIFGPEPSRLDNSSLSLEAENMHGGIDTSDDETPSTPDDEADTDGLKEQEELNARDGSNPNDILGALPMHEDHVQFDIRDQMEFMQEEPGTF